MFDIFYIQLSDDLENWKTLKTKFPIAKRVKSFTDAQSLALTNFFWIVWEDLIVDKDFNFDYIPDQWSTEYVHVFKNGEHRDGIVLVPKSSKLTDKEIKHRFFINKKEIDIVASTPAKYDYFVVNSYSDYLTALESSKTELFWTSSANILVDENLINNFYISYHDQIDRKQNHAFVHLVDDVKYYNGLFLCTKHRPLTQKEVDYRHIVNRKEWDIVGSTKKQYDVFEIDSYNDYLKAIDASTTEMFWMSSRNITATIPDIYFTHDNEYDRKQNHAFVHLVDNVKYYNGLFLCSKHRPLTQKEVDYRHIVNRKEWDIVSSTKKNYDVFEIDSYDEYLTALTTSSTEMFWMSSRNIAAIIPDIYFTHDNEYDRKQNHAFVHLVDDVKYYNGLFLCSKHRPLTQKEVDYRHIVNRKEWNIVGSGPCKYDMFNVKNYDDYLIALETSHTEMFWIVPEYVNPTNRFKYDTYFTHNQEYDRKINHTYLNGKYHDGIMLCSKYSPFTKREFDFKFIANKKEINTIISTPKPYDIVFISYQEPNADEYYKYLVDRFPRAKRVHGVKGIHQAHIAAAQQCSTDMFWVVDGDALIDPNFKFNYQVAQWDRETVHVWRSINPINDLVYGYGGVKLLPTELVLNMNISKPDMTTSISRKFRVIQEISNITAFNSDPFNTWKSAFRECVKLSSNIIDRQKDDETNNRLKIWCTVGEDRPYGKFAINGATAGTKYGLENQNNIEALAKINDFMWLKEQFNVNS